MPGVHVRTFQRWAGRGRIGGRDELRDNRRGSAVSGILQRGQIFIGRSAGSFGIDLLVPVRTRDRAALVGISLDEACVHRKAFTADEPGADTGGNHALEDLTGNIMIAEAFGTRFSWSSPIAVRTTSAPRSADRRASRARKPASRTRAKRDAG